MAGQKGRSGGPRKNSGRKPKAVTLARAALVQAIDQQIAIRASGLVENLLKLADGTLVEMAGKDGTLTVYMTLPDFKANEYLLNRVLGKPAERHELTGAEGQPIDLNLTVQTRAAQELATWRAQQTAQLSSSPRRPPT